MLERRFMFIHTDARKASDIYCLRLFISPYSFRKIVF